MLGCKLFKQKEELSF